MKDFDKYLQEVGEVGSIREVVGPIAYAVGLPKARPFELVVFENGEFGQVFSVKKDVVEVLTFAKTPLAVGLRATRTGKIIDVPVGKELISNVIDPFGGSFENHKMFNKPTERRSLEESLMGISARKTIKRSFETGVSIVDLMVPLGRGQRELVIGDRKTGKTSFLFQTIVYAAKQGEICIYAAIGKNKIEIKRAEEYFAANNVLDRVVIVASSSQDPAGVVYLTPFSAMTIAEYFRDQGQDTLVVMDDLSTHAKFYREISLIGKRFPGRDSYPGDMFYIHARLLERGGNFHTKDGGEVSITCLPVVQTLQGDLSGYIQTNIMSMTDGHIYFDSNLFTQGRRPSINPFLSVTRVGRQTQPDSKRSISRELITFLTLFDKMQNIVHFGSELTEAVRVILDTGNKVLQLFDQETHVVVPGNVQPIVLSLLWGEDSRKIDVSKLAEMRGKISELYIKNPDYRKMVDDVVLKSSSFNEILALVKDNAAKFGISIPTLAAFSVNTNTTTPPPQAQPQPTQPATTQDKKPESSH